MSLLHHAWVSQEGMSEAYNESHKDSKKVKLFNDFLRKNKKIGSLAQFNKVNEEDGGLDDEVAYLYRVYVRVHVLTRTCA